MTPFDQSLLKDTQLGSDSGSDPDPGPGSGSCWDPAESGLCCFLVHQQNTHRALNVNNDGGLM